MPAPLPRPALAALLCVYVVALLWVSLRHRARVHTLEDFTVAGRSLSWPLSTATLVATWFGAGALLTTADEVSSRGLSATALDPLGAGLSLFIAGVAFAVPLWRLRLLTLAELFGRAYGPRLRTLSAWLMLPTYIGWIAAQYVALSGVLRLVLGVPAQLGVALACGVGLTYTLAGGMWSIAVTDAIQLAVIAAGLIAMLARALWLSGDGLWAAVQALPDADQRLSWLPVDSPDAPALLSFLAVLSAGALGNLPSQDIMQRVFSARSASVARRACLTAGAIYMALAAGPVLLGLAAPVWLPADLHGQGSVLTQLAFVLLQPWSLALFVLALVAAVLSTIDSATLAPATILAADLFPATPRAHETPGGAALRRARLFVVLVSALSLVVALLGASAWTLLESSYELGAVSLLAPLVYAVHGRTRSPAAAASSMLLGVGLWAFHGALGLDTVPHTGIPVGLAATAASFLVYPAVTTLQRWRDRAGAAAPR